MRHSTLLIATLLTLSACARQSASPDGPPGPTKVAMESNGNCSNQVRNDANELVKQAHVVDQLHAVSSIVSFSEEILTESSENFNQAVNRYREQVNEFRQAYGDFECNYAADNQHMKVLSSAAIYASPNAYQLFKPDNFNGVTACASEMSTSYQKVLNDLQDPVARLKAWTAGQAVTSSGRKISVNGFDEVDSAMRDSYKAIAGFRRGFKGEYDCTLTSPRGIRVHLKSKSLDDRLELILLVLGIGQRRIDI